jgi:cAMP phosphodiesterase
MTCLIDEHIAIDAGCLGNISPLSRQDQVQQVFLTHSHIDHIATLPVFLDNVFQHSPDCPTVYANAATLQCLQQNFFNDRVWPDLHRLSEMGAHFLTTCLVTDGQPLQLDGYRIIPTSLKHVVPTTGYVIHDDSSAVAFVWDTRPTEAIWEQVNCVPNLKAVFLEASFPNEECELAQKTGHLTPHLFKLEVQKLQRDVPVIAVHIKPAFHERVVAQLKALGLPQLEIGRPGQTYEF